MERNKSFRNTLIVIFTSAILVSCFSTKNEYGSRRFNTSRFKLKPNTNPDYVNIIDTSALYIQIHTKEFIKKYGLENYITGYKFYNKGRVGLFKGVNFSKPDTFNPKKASMCFYNYTEDGFFIESLTPVPGGGYALSKGKIIKVGNDTLLITRFKSAISSSDTIYFKKKKLPVGFLRFKPDW
ncbi:hypothetical protein [Winogradskyella flava]|uniref:hypothetical protein n=1 Tax=Winogradskyella flava TaxID=1884876 RepID=UPI00248F574D|nr:hypothetical protein [Winogradskyella flava]